MGEACNMKNEKGYLCNTVILRNIKMVKSFNFEQRIPSNALRTSIAPSVASHPTRGRPFLLFYRTQPLPASNQGEQQRDGAFARDVRRNQEEHRGASLLRPSPTLFNLLKKLHTCSGTCTQSASSSFRGVQSGGRRTRHALFRNVSMEL